MWDNDYKHPVVLAKELATIDVLSGGRLEIGLGAGWMATDYEQSGIPYDSNKVRVDRFEEGLAVIKAALSGEPFSFDGSHYTHHRLHRARRDRCSHRARRSWSVAAASGCCRSPHARPTSSASTARCRPALIGPEAIATMTADGRRSEGRDRPAPRPGLASPIIEFNIRAFLVRVTDDRDAAVEQIAGFVQVDPSMVLESPFVLIGTPAQIVDDLLRRRERWGFSYVIVGADDVEPFAPVVAELAGH